MLSELEPRHPHSSGSDSSAEPYALCFCVRWQSGAATFGDAAQALLAPSAAPDARRDAERFPECPAPAPVYAGRWPT